MAETRDMPGLGGYDFDHEADMPVVRADYDLFGTPEGRDMLSLDRATEHARLTGNAALFPEREFMINMGRTDILEGPEDIVAPRGGQDA